MIHQYPTLPVDTYHCIRREYANGNKEFYVEELKSGSFIEIGNLIFSQDDWLSNFIISARDDIKTQVNDYNGGPLEGYDRTQYLRNYVREHIDQDDAQFIMANVPGLIHAEFYQNHSTLNKSFRFTFFDVIVEAFAEWLHFRI